MKTILAIISLSAFLVIAIFAVWHWNNSETGCIFDKQASLCHMTVTEHIAFWQILFAAVIFIFVIGTVGYFLVIGCFNNNKESAERFYLKEHPEARLFDYLRQAFSQGIINPKIF